MRFLQSPIRAFTLVELILATAVVGVIAMGIVSSELAVRKHSVSASDSTSASINVQNILNHVINTASQAQGGATSKGILIGAAETGDANTSCMRMTSSSWSCYTLISSSLYTCSKSSAGTCSSADTLVGLPAKTQSVVSSFNLSTDLFSTAVTVADSSTSTGIRSASASVSPPAHGATPCNPACISPQVCAGSSCCTPNCLGKACGSDGCGGSCGSCGSNQICSSGSCVNGCTPDCAGKTCGSDGCSGSCGSCSINQTCTNSNCVNNCTPICNAATAANTCVGAPFNDSCGNPTCVGTKPAVNGGWTTVATCQATACGIGGYEQPACTNPVPSCGGAACPVIAHYWQWPWCPIGQQCQASATCKAGPAPPCDPPDEDGNQNCPPPSLSCQCNAGLHLCGGQCTTFAACCNNSAECPSNPCATGTCVKGTHDDCDEDGTCHTEPDATGVCSYSSPTPDSCSGMCVNLKSNVNNCGACGNQCTGYAAKCYQGACCAPVYDRCDNDGCGGNPGAPCDNSYQECDNGQCVDNGTPSGPGPGGPRPGGPGPGNPSGPPSGGGCSLQPPCLCTGTCFACGGSVCTSGQSCCNGSCCSGVCDGGPPNVCHPFSTLLCGSSGNWCQPSQSCCLNPSTGANACCNAGTSCHQLGNGVYCQ